MIAGGLLLSLSVGIFFVVRAVRPAIYWHYHKDEPIESWMSVVASAEQALAIVQFDDDGKQAGQTRPHIRGEG